MTTHRTVLSVEEYLDELLGDLLAGAGPITDTEEVPLAEALGRVLARDVVSAGDVPAFANSAMDGYAVRHDDLVTLPARLRVVADVPAGSGADPRIAAGECVRIMTGAPLPGDADTIVPVELTDSGTETVTVTEAPDRGRHVRGAGEDVRAGDLVVASGTTLTGRHIGAIAAAGAGTVTARRAPVVVVAATGDELIAPGGDLGRGQIYESNAAHLIATLAELGVTARRNTSLADDVDGFTRALDELADDVDLVILTGGVSVGAFDVSRIALEGSGDGVFRHVRMQPGKPQGWARWRGRTPVLAFPGNPVSAAISFELFGRPVIDRLLGRIMPSAPDRAVAAEGWTPPSGRRQYLPVRLSSDDEGRLLATPNHRRGSASHMVTSLAGAHALAVVPEDVDAVTAGDVLEIRSLS